MRWSALLLILTLTVDALACGRCGFLRSCRYVPKVRTQVVEKTKFVPTTTQTFVFNNTAPLPQVGSAVYGYSAATQPLTATSRELLMLANRSQDAVTALATTASERMESESEVYRLSAAASALTATMTAARDVQAAGSVPHTTIMRQTVYPDGSIKTERLDPALEGYAAEHAKQSEATTAKSVLGRRCVKCHGPDRSEKGVRLDQPITAAVATKAQRLIFGDKMPPDDPLPDEDIEAAFRELLQLELTKGVTLESNQGGM